jgi:site-specific recombinase
MLKLLKHKKAPLSSDSGKAPSLSATNYHDIELLVELVKLVRPSKPGNIEEAEAKFQSLLLEMNENSSLLFSIRKALLSWFVNSNIMPALTKSGIVSSRGFIQEMA